LPRTGDRLSLGRTLVSAYAILGRHLLAFVGLSILLAAVTDGFTYLAELLIDDDTPETLADAIYKVARASGVILAQLMSIVIGIAWFRIILLDEPHRLRSYLRFGRRELRYLGVDIGMGCLIAVPMFVFGIAVAVTIQRANGDASWVESYMVPLTAGTLVWGAVCTAWLGLAYPAIATDAGASGSLRLSVRLTRGNRVPLFLAYLLGASVWDIAALAMMFIVPESADALRPIDFLATLISAAASMCFLAVSAAAYRQLQGRSLAELAGAFD